MSCSSCSNNPSGSNCPSCIGLTTDESYLIPSCGGVAGQPVDLQPLVELSETDTRMQLDIDAESIIYTGERATNDESSADNIPIPSISALMDIGDLRDVQDSSNTNGDLLSWNATLGKWVSYTVPTGTIVTPAGVDVDGNLVKDGTGGTPQAPDTIPIGGALEWTGDVADIPVNFHIMDGSPINRTVYSDLFDLWGTRYGPGDGTTTFNLPKSSGRVSVGLDVADTQFSTIGQTGGEKAHTISVAEMPPHHHDYRIPVNINDTDRGGNSSLWSIDNQVDTATSTTGGGVAHNNLQPYIVFPKIVRII